MDRFSNFWYRRVQQVGCWFKEIDWHLFLPYLFLSAAGIILVFSASSYRAVMEGGQIWAYALRQGIFTILGFIVLMLVYRVNIGFFRRKITAWTMVLVITSALLFVLVAGAEINGAKGWIQFGFFSIQPIEFAKPVLVIWLADYFARHEHEFARGDIWPQMKADFIPLLVPLVWLGIAFLLPDIGGLSILLAISVLLFLASGVGVKFTYWVLCMGIVGYALLYGIVMALNHFNIQPSNYQLVRLMTFVNPFLTARGAGLQQVNSLYALNSGGWIGRGIGNSVQKMGYLPEAHNDFIMAIVGEELGLIGLVAIVGIYVYMIIYMIRRVRRVADSYRQLIVIGTVAYLIVQMSINLGAVLGLLPVTGVTFPLISYGGSSILTTAIFIGLALSAIRADNKRVRLVAQNGSQKGPKTRK